MYQFAPFNGIGPLGTVTSGANATLRFADTISKIIGFLTILGGIWFMVQLILGAFSWISAGGDKQHLDSAKKRITNAIIGLFIVVVSFSLIAIIGSFFGLDILNLDSAIRGIAPT